VIFQGEHAVWLLEGLLERGQALRTGVTATGLARGRTGGPRWWAYGRAGVLCLLSVCAARAATFSSATYDSSTNELVVTMVYGGSNPNHRFSAQWGTCRKLGKEGNHQIAVDLLDDQWNDVAQQTFTTTVRVSLAGVDCHPATVTLRTAPKYEYTLQIP
jgi:hypothetical protein